LRQDNEFLRLRVDSISPRVTCPLRSAGITPLPRLAQPATPPRLRVRTWRFELVTLSLHRSMLLGRTIGPNRLFLAGIVGRIDVAELQRRSAVDLDHNFWLNDEIRLATIQALLPHKSSLMNLLACCKSCITFTSSLFRILKVVSVRPRVRAPVFADAGSFHRRFPLGQIGREGNRNPTRASFELRGVRSRCIQKHAEADFVHSIIPYWTGLPPHATGPGRRRDWLLQYEEATD